MCVFVGMLITGRDDEEKVLADSSTYIQKSISILLQPSESVTSVLTNEHTTYITNEVLTAVGTSYSHQSYIYSSEPSLLLQQSEPHILPCIFHSSTPYNLRNFIDPINFHPPCHEWHTLRHELFPLEEISSHVSEVDYYIQWALHIGGLGLGLMLIDGKIEKIELIKELNLVKNKLIELYARDVDVIDDGRLVLLLAALCKLSAQLHNQEDAYIYITKFEFIANNYGDPYYHALSIRFRLDYCEWVGSYHTFNTLIVLPNEIICMHICKKYYHISELTMDIHLRRDAIKKLINSYINIANATFDGYTDMEYFSFSRSKERSIEKLSLFTAKEIEEKEVSDVFWMKEFSYARSLFFAGLLSKLK